MENRTVYAIVLETWNSLKIVTWAWSYHSARSALLNIDKGIGEVYEIIETDFSECLGIKHYNVG
jgi:hypothetical protein